MKRLYYLFFLIVGVIILNGCASKKDIVSSYATAINEEYVYCCSGDLRYEILNFSDGLELFVISQGEGFDLYRFKDPKHTAIDYIGTFSDLDHLEYDPENGILCARYSGERDVLCIVQIKRNEDPLLIQTFEEVNGNYYKDVESSVRGYYGQKIMSEYEGGRIDTSTTFLSTGVEMSTSEKQGNLSVLDECKTLFYKEMYPLSLTDQ